jgi:hypothetical protein
MLEWDCADVEIDGRMMSRTEERCLFGSEFERLGQERRVEVLRAYGVIDEETKAQKRCSM